MKIRKLDIIVYPAFIVIVLDSFIEGLIEGFKAGYSGAKFQPFPDLAFSGLDIFFLSLNVLLMIFATILYIRQRD